MADVRLNTHSPGTRAVIVNDAFFVVIALSLLVGGSFESNGRLPQVTGVCALALAVVNALSARDVWPSSDVLTETTITHPRLVRRRSIDLTTVAGVALVKSLRLRGRGTNLEAGNGWCLTLWLLDGSLVRLRAVRYVPPGGSGWSRRRHATAPVETSEELARSAAGRAAVAVATRVLEVQGEAGPFATRHLERTPIGAVPARSWPRYFAIWSTDGSLERAPEGQGTR